jgi:hypothetical protein
MWPIIWFWCFHCLKMEMVRFSKTLTSYHNTYIAPQSRKHILQFCMLAVHIDNGEFSVQLSEEFDILCKNNRSISKGFVEMPHEVCQLFRHLQKAYLYPSYARPYLSPQDCSSQHLMEYHPTACPLYSRW